MRWAIASPHAARIDGSGKDALALRPAGSIRCDRRRGRRGLITGHRRRALRALSTDRVLPFLSDCEVCALVAPPAASSGCACRAPTPPARPAVTSAASADGTTITGRAARCVSAAGRLSDITCGSPPRLVPHTINAASRSVRRLLDRGPQRAARARSPAARRPAPRRGRAPSALACGVDRRLLLTLVQLRGVGELRRPACRGRGEHLADRLPGREHDRGRLRTQRGERPRARARRRRSRRSRRRRAPPARHARRPARSTGERRLRCRAGAVEQAPPHLLQPLAHPARGEEECQQHHRGAGTNATAGAGPLRTGSCRREATRGRRNGVRSIPRAAR